MRKIIILGAVACTMGAVLSACVQANGSADCAAPETLRVGSYNIRGSTLDRKTPNAWKFRRADVVELLKKLNLDLIGLQEVSPEQHAYLNEHLPEYGIVGDHRGADRKSDSASPVAYRKSRFDVESSGTFWLSETPDVPASKSWGTACTRVCSYLVLRDKKTGRRFSFANAHTDHRSAEAREKGMLLIIERMKKFAPGLPIVFTGDHNCCYEDAPAKAVRALLKDARDITETPCQGPRSTFQGFGRRKDSPGKRVNGVLCDLCIDYIYVSEGTRVLDFVTHDDKRAGSDRYPSDHYPITATIVL